MRIARDKEGMVISRLVLQFSPKRSHSRTHVSREAIYEYFVTKAKFRNDSRLNEFDKPIGSQYHRLAAPRFHGRKPLRGYER